MPIQGADLSIYGPQKGAVVPYVSSDQVAAQAEVTAQKQAAAQKLREAALDDARERAAVNASLDPKTGAPDPERFGAAAVKYQLSPERAAKVQKGFDDHYEAVGKQQTARDTHLEAQKKFNAERWGTITDQATLDVMREMYPEEFKNVPQDYESAKPNVQVMAQAATSEADKAKMRIEALKEQRDAVDDLPKSLAAAATFVANDDAGNYSNAINGGLKGLGWKQAVIDRLPQQYDAQKLADIAMGPKDVATLAGQADTRSRMDASQQETARHNQQMEKTALIRANKPPASGGAAGPAKSTMHDEAINQAADRYFETGVLPSLGMGNAAAADKRAIMDRASERHPGGSLSYNTAAFAANKNTLTKLQNQSSAIAAFENTASKNLKQFEDLAAKVPDTGVPWLNTPVRLLNQQLVGSANMAAVNAARQVALTEISRVVSNPNLTGALSDSAREEVLGLVPQNATLKQIQRVANVLRTDMQNRRQSIDEQKSDIEKRLGKGDEKPTPAAQKPADYVYDPVSGTLKKKGGD